MGFPIRSNIFNIGGTQQKYFSRFPIQVAVLYSPSDEDFLEAFKDLFLHLDQVTGDEVAFFALLDPPRDWREAAKTREWWQNYRAEVGELGFAADEHRMLTLEIARRFNVAWHELPALVISTNLWTGEFASTPTGTGHIEHQLTALTNLCIEWGLPTMPQIIQLLEEMGDDVDVRYHPSDYELRYHFSRLYGALNTYNPQNGDFDLIRYRRDYLEPSLEAVSVSSNVLRRRRSRDIDDDSDYYRSESELFNSLIGELTGRLVPTTTVAMKVYEQLGQSRDIPIIDALEEESLVMLETGLNVGNFLEVLSDDRIPQLMPLKFQRHRRSDRRESSYHEPFDFSPGAHGVWKMLELEANFSVIQAARAKRGIDLPNYFAIYQSGVDKEDTKVFTGYRYGDRTKPIYRNINNQDKRNSPRHQFFTLGDSWHITNGMVNLTRDDLPSFIDSHVGLSMPGDLLHRWKKVYDLRNTASHRSPLAREEYEQTLQNILAYDFIGFMMDLKNRLRNT